MLARVNCRNCHNLSPNGSQRFRHWMDRVLLPAIQSRFARIIDPNAVLSLSVAFQYFKSIARQRVQILKLDRRFQAIQLEPARSIPENALTRLPAAKSLVRLSR